MSTATTDLTLANATGTWVIDPTHTTLGFTARHAMVAKVRGVFADFSGSFTIDGDNLAASSAELTSAPSLLSSSGSTSDKGSRTASSKRASEASSGSSKSKLMPSRKAPRTAATCCAM